MLPLELIDLIIELINEDDLPSLANCALANSHCLRSARKRMFSKPFTLDSVEGCLFLKKVITTTPIVARCITHLRIDGGHIPDCDSVHGDPAEDEELAASQSWLHQAYPIWKELPCIRDLGISFISWEFLFQWECSLEDLAFASVETLDLYHIEFHSPLHFQLLVNKFTNLRHLILSRISNEDPDVPLDVENMPPLPIPETPLAPPPLSKLTLGSTSYLEDWRPVDEWLIDRSPDARLRELWYLYDDNVYYRCYLGGLISAVSQSLERLSLGFVWGGLWPDQFEHFDTDLRAITLPRLRYLCLFGDLSVRSVMPILSLAPPTLEELAFQFGTNPLYSWVHESSAADVWGELSHCRFGKLERLGFHLWGKTPAIAVAMNVVKVGLEGNKRQMDILEFTQGKIVLDLDGTSTIALPLNPHMLR